MIFAKKWKKTSSCSIFFKKNTLIYLPIYYYDQTTLLFLLISLLGIPDILHEFIYLIAFFFADNFGRGIGIVFQCSFSAKKCVFILLGTLFSSFYYFNEGKSLHLVIFSILISSSSSGCLFSPRNHIL